MCGDAQRPRWESSGGSCTGLSQVCMKRAKCVRGGNTPSSLPLRVTTPWTPPLHTFASALKQTLKKKKKHECRKRSEEEFFFLIPDRINLLWWMPCVVHRPVRLPWLKEKKTLAKERWKYVRDGWKDSSVEKSGVCLSEITLHVIH